jgi:hypothetical protein
MNMQYHTLNNELFSSHSSGGRHVIPYIERVIMTLCPNDTTLLPSHM